MARELNSQPLIVFSPVIVLHLIIFHRLERWRHFEEKYKEAGEWLQSLEELVALSGEQNFDNMCEVRN